MTAPPPGPPWAPTIQLAFVAAVMVVALVITHDAWSLVPLSTVALGVLRWRVPFADLFRR